LISVIHTPFLTTNSLIRSSTFSTFIPFCSFIFMLVILVSMNLSMFHCSKLS
jgi:hypothetical protein